MEVTLNIYDNNAILSVLGAASFVFDFDKLPIFGSDLAVHLTKFTEQHLPGTPKFVSDNHAFLESV